MLEIQDVSLDDPTGDPATAVVNFGFRGAWYELDLTAAHAGMIESLLVEWSARGRRRPDPSVVSGGRMKNDRSRSAGIRAWARDSGLVVADTGRILRRVVDAYAERDTHARTAGVRTRLDTAPIGRALPDVGA